jgi:hypothetical protein
MNNKDNQLLAEAYKKVSITENTDPAISQAMGEIMAFLAVIAAAGAPAVISQIKEELKQKAAMAKKERMATASITNRTISPEEQRAQLNAKAAPAPQQQAPAQ